MCCLQPVYSKEYVESIVPRHKPPKTVSYAVVPLAPLACFPACSLGCVAWPSGLSCCLCCFTAGCSPAASRCMAGVELLASSMTHSSTALVRHNVLQGYEKVGYYSVQLMRRSFDLLTGYRPDRSMSEEKWLQRILFLETVAGALCLQQSARPGCQRSSFKTVLCLHTLAGIFISGCKQQASSSAGVHASLQPVASVMDDPVAVRPPFCSQAAVGGRAAGGMLTDTDILHPQCETVTWISGCVEPVHSECQQPTSY